jgi:hypothetical protein
VAGRAAAPPSRVYLASPLDLVRDFVPAIAFADDAAAGPRGAPIRPATLGVKTRLIVTIGLLAPELAERKSGGIDGQC